MHLSSKSLDLLMNILFITFLVQCNLQSLCDIRVYALFLIIDSSLFKS